MKIVPITEANYPQVKEIYLQGIATGNATFQTDAPTWADWDKGHSAHSRIAAIDDESCMIGWAALSPVSGRCVYAGVAEVSVYIEADHRGKGVGDFLLGELVNSSEANGIWTLQAGVFSENAASIKLHEKQGFRIVGRRERIGQMNNVWRDTILLERRSNETGI